MKNMIGKVAVAAVLTVAVAGAAIAAQKTGSTAAGTAAVADSAGAARVKGSFGKLGNAVNISGNTVMELSAADCKAVGGKVETHDGCMTVGGNDVGLKCVVGGNHVCIDEANAN